MIYCSNCGKPIPDENKFCNSCGTAKPLVEPQKTDTVEPQKAEITEQQKSNVAEAIKTATASANPAPQQPASTVTKPGSNIAIFNNVGFWGALLLLIGFFLPFYKTIMDTNLTDISLAKMAGGGDSAAGRILLFLLPASAIVLIIQAFYYPFHPLIANIAKILPLLLMVFALGAIMREDETGRSVGSFFEIAQIGVYVTLLGALLMLFFRRKR